MISQRFIFICELPYILENDRNSFYRYLLNGLEFSCQKQKIISHLSLFPWNQQTKILRSLLLLSSPLFLYILQLQYRYSSVSDTCIRNEQENKPELLRKTSRLNPDKKDEDGALFFFLKQKKYSDIIVYEIQLWHEADNHHLIPS